MNIAAFIAKLLLVTFIFDFILHATGHKTLGESLWLALQLAYDYAANGMGEVADVIRSNTAKVVEAINAVAKALKVTIEQLSRWKLFPIIESLTPNIYAFNVRQLARRPDWFVLYYNGVGNPQTRTNHEYIRITYKHLRATAPIGYHVDEFPYACTAQGGAFGPAQAELVPAGENLRQGGLLGAFTRYTLQGRAQPFVVVPVPL
jgi:hypothetical protein